jgi:hypothetical protein
MPDSEAKKQWMQKNTVLVSARFNRNTDADIFSYFGDVITAGDVKKAVREYIENHPKTGKEIT